MVMVRRIIIECLLVTGQWLSHITKLIDASFLYTICSYGTKVSNVCSSLMANSIEHVLVA